MPKDSMSATIESVRKTLGMTQEAFADELGVAQGIISVWESGKFSPSAENYMELANLATKHKLYREADRFVQAAGAGETTLLAAAAYRGALIDAQAEYPNDPIAQHRYATRASERALRLRKKEPK